MTPVARVALCKELYDLSGWRQTSFESECLPDGTYTTTLYVGRMSYHPENLYYPAYDLGYLVRRLPAQGWTLQRSSSEGGWEIHYRSRRWTQEIISQAETPEDAVCWLAIELFKRGLLVKEEEHPSYRL